MPHAARQCVTAVGTTLRVGSTCAPRSPTTTVSMQQCASAQARDAVAHTHPASCRRRVLLAGYLPRRTGGGATQLPARRHLFAPPLAASSCALPFARAAPRPQLAAVTPHYRHRRWPVAAAGRLAALASRAAHRCRWHAVHQAQAVAFVSEQTWACSAAQAVPSWSG